MSIFSERNFNFFMATAVLLILVIPVGIANIYLGYFIGESPCTLCWNERIGMIIIGILGIFILRYGLKMKYIAGVFISAAYGLLMTIRHTSLDGFAWDVGMGFGTSMFGAHTYTWGVFVYWAVIIVMSVLLIFVKNKQIAKDLTSDEIVCRKLNPYSKIVVIASFVIVLSNAFQAFFLTGIPPFSGKGEPERMSLNILQAKEKWTTGVWTRLQKSFSLTGRNVVDAPLVEKESYPKKFSFNANPHEGPIADLNSKLEILDTKKLPFKAIGIFQKGNASTLAYNKNKNEFVVGSTQAGFYFTDENFEKVTSSAILDKPNGYDIPLLVSSTFIDDMLVTTSYNKTLVAIERENLDKIDSFKEWNTFRQTTGGLKTSWYRSRPVVLTIRAKKSYILSIAKDPNSKFLYMLSVPNEVNKNIILIKIDSTDNILSGESILKIDENLKLKSDRSVHEYYITASEIQDDKILAFSKNFNTMLVIDIQSQKITNAYELPDIGTINDVAIKDSVIYALNFKDNETFITKLKMPF